MKQRGPIQIWTPTRDGWVRPPAGPFGDHYSAVGSLQERSLGQPRLLLIGESVATGYLYAPWYTPAGVLAELLPSWDIVDLARTNESLETLATSLDHGLQLEPDVVVMWAGNNWLLRDLGSLSPYHADCSHRVAIAEALRRSGTAGLQQLAERELRLVARHWLELIGARVERAGTRLIVVVPEVNLVDWESCQPVTVLPAGTESEWYDALAAGDARRMASIDCGATATTSRRLGELEIGQSQIELFRKEVAAAAGPLRAVSTSPMASTEVQHILREWADSSGFEAIDVATLIEDADSRPDRVWFLDYCHHTAHGIEAVVTAVAQTASGNAVAKSNPPPDELQAVAALGALLHTDHRLVSSGDRRPLLQHWKDAAGAIFPGSDALIGDLVDSRIGSVALPLTDAQRRNQARSFPFGFAHGWRPMYLELDAMLVLGVTETQFAQLALPAERAWPSSLALRPGRTLWVDDQPRSTYRGITQAIWPTSEFAVRVRQGERTDVRLTVRLRRPGQIRLTLGDWSCNASVDQSWTTVRATIPGDAAMPGLHPLRITWPRLEPGPERWEAMLGALAADRPGQLHPIFGEVHSLLVSDQ